ncbi:hypothetical protein HK101_005310, partial [Irineochytrium annulatum]
MDLDAFADAARRTAAAIDPTAAISSPTPSSVATPPVITIEDHHRPWEDAVAPLGDVMQQHQHALNDLEEALSEMGDGIEDPAIPDVGSPMVNGMMGLNGGMVGMGGSFGDLLMPPVRGNMGGRRGSSGSLQGLGAGLGDLDLLSDAGSDAGSEYTNFSGSNFSIYQMPSPLIRAIPSPLASPLIGPIPDDMYFSELMRSAAGPLISSLEPLPPNSFTTTTDSTGQTIEAFFNSMTGLGNPIVPSSAADVSGLGIGMYGNGGVDFNRASSPFQPATDLYNQQAQLRAQANAILSAPNSPLLTPNLGMPQHQIPSLGADLNGFLSPNLNGLAGGGYPSATSPAPSDFSDSFSRGGSVEPFATAHQQQFAGLAGASPPPAVEERPNDDPILLPMPPALRKPGENGRPTLYQCPFPDCLKTFTRQYNLKSHYRSHTGERPYLCRFCPHTFSRKHDLRRHEKLHGGGRPFACVACGRGFARADALKRHLRGTKE